MDSLQNFVLTPEMSGLMYSGPSPFNPCRYFGQSTIWPRGYPLSALDDTPDHSFRLSTNWATPIIQQGLVNGDPDVDAIFRLTRRPDKSPLNVTFDPVTPPVLVPEGVFSPFNTQNTLFHYPAMWALFLPATKTFRVVDIWRGYWAQRLMWEIGGRLGFFPPNTAQVRNSHSYLIDATLETDLYFSTEGLLSFLAAWTCPEALTFFQCVQQLSSDMAHHGFWGSEDAERVALWLLDLRGIGYQEPRRVKVGERSSAPSVAFTYSQEETLPVKIPSPVPGPDEIRIDGEFPDNGLHQKWNDTVSQGTFVQFAAAEQASPNLPINDWKKVTPFSQHADHIASVCPTTLLPLRGDPVKSAVADFFSGVLLMIVYNWPYYANVRYLEAFYRTIFHNIVYCGENRTKFMEETANISKTLSFVETSIGGGKFGYNCLVNVVQMNYGVKGYFVVADDDVLNIWKFLDFDLKKIWLQKDMEIINPSCTPGWSWWNHPLGKKPYTKAMQQLKEIEKKGEDGGVIPVKQFMKNLSTFTKGTKCLHGISDIYFIPDRLAKDFIFYLKPFIQSRAMIELAIPIVAFGVAPQNDITTFVGPNLYYNARKTPFTKFSEDIYYLHPVKLSKEENRKQLCSVYATRFLQRVYGISRKNKTLPLLS